MNYINNNIRALLERAPVPIFSGYAIAAAFTTYFCMYAFRKPFAVAEYTNLYIGSGEWKIELKIVLIISQLIGYALSKCLGVKFLSELKPHRRYWALLAMIAWAEAALALFAVLPPEGKVVAIFLNGLPLGAVWGLVFGFLEGRQTSELLGAGLSCSYIVASGAVKSVGKYLMLNHNISESAMPFVTGLCFAPLFLLASWALSLLPQPTEKDKEMRTQREPMDSQQRWAFVNKFFFGLMLLTMLYFFLTAYRDFRDNFAAEIWKELGYIASVDEKYGADLDTGEIPAIIREKFSIHEIQLSAAAAIEKNQKKGTWEIKDGEQNYLVEPNKQQQLDIFDPGGAAIFTLSELPIALLVMISLALIYVIQDNRIGLLVTHYLMLGGTVLIGVCTILFDFGIINGTVWMILVGLGLYLAYVPYGCVLFDRLIAAVGFVATAVFMIYLTDSVGYIGSVGINLYKNFGQSELSKLGFFRYFSYFTSVFCSLCFFGSLLYFQKASKKGK